MQLKYMTLIFIPLLLFTGCGKNQEPSGNADRVMAEVADKFQERVGQRTRRLIGLLEPSLVAVLSILVGIILLSVMLPLLGVLTGMNL